MIKTVIFDMDGVIYSSEPLHDKARAMLLRHFNIPTDIVEVAGKSHKDIWDPLVEEYKLRNTQPEIERMQHELVIEMVKQYKLPLCEGVMELLNELNKRGKKVALASSSGRWLVTNILEYYQIKNKFFSIVCGDDVHKRKPDPEIYLEVLKECSCLPEEVIAIEDSDSGQAAAVAAGIRCIGYRNPTSGTQKLCQGIACIDDIRCVLPYINI